MPDSWSNVRASLQTGSYLYSDMFALIAAAYVSRSWAGEPLWILIVGPPGSGKTSCATLYSETADIKLISSLTPASLISGWGGEVCDRSLLAELTDCLLIAKDFGTILSLGWHQTNEIFGVLREAYDGHITKDFGMLRREYWPHFNFIGCTTEAAERYQCFRSQLGERFLRYTHVPPKLPSPPIRFDKSLIAKISVWADSFLVGAVPVLSLTDRQALGTLARTCALLRTEVIHDGHSHEVLEIPQFEQPTRLSLQLEKLYGGLLTVTGDGGESLRITKKVATSIIAPRKMNILKELLAAGKGVEQTEIAEKLRLGYSVVRNVLIDFYTLGLVHREMQGFPKKYLWSIDPSFLKAFTEFLS